ncbi:MAG: hypothetical protein ABEJ92_03390 [Halobacteriales archaeon]
MADPRTVLAAALGVGLGLVLLAFPAAVVRVQTVGRLPHDRGGEYGRSGEPPRRWLLVVRGLGAVLVLVGLGFAASVLGWLPAG